MNEIKDAEMMGHIIGGFFTFNFGFRGNLGNSLAFDLDNDGTIEANEFFTPFSFNSQISIDFGDLLGL
ncbi:hypothetical protein BJP36_34995 [Moorena producens JHB]|uniref:EF-hand domain-containing protein n=1 Tax=Moorena producens (strain JHB) TaxID=1454205 RepID=A0A1D9G9P8_MOOP1|nr:hypothetical protein [Moorena producens]AOY84362.2 hypothetical protein BJP36_34995 [Moorena producens JHB]